MVWVTAVFLATPPGFDDSVECAVRLERHILTTSHVDRYHGPIGSGAYICFHAC